MSADPDLPSSPNHINRLARRLAELRWPIVIIVVGAAAVQQALLFALLRFFPAVQQEWIHLAAYSLTGVIVVWLGLAALLRAAARQEQAEADLRVAYADLAQTHRQLQAIHEVGRRVTNSSDVQELLEIAARIPVELLGATGASVITFDAERERSSLELTYGLDERAVQALRQQTERAHLAQQCVNCQPLTAHLSAECQLLASVAAAGNGRGPERIVCMPLGRGQERSGVVSAYLQPGAQPSPEQIHLASILATEVTGALEAARLRARQMATLYAVDQATQERSGLDGLLSRVLDTTIEGWGVQAGAILLTSGDSWEIRAQRGLGDDLAAPAIGLALRLAERARAASHAILLQERIDSGPLASSALLLLQAEGETLGALFLGSQEPDAFKPAQIDLMKAIASQIALAVRNAQLYSQLRQSAVIEERYRLSREMHDGVAQTLGYLGMQAERIEGMVDRGEAERLPAELKELRQVIAEAYLDLRETIDGLRLTVDQPGGFSGALQAHLEDFTRRSGLAVDCSGVEAPADLSPTVALHLLRITQEALANVRRHANASRVAIGLARENGALELTISDDGQGFDAASPLERGHIGLASMRERVRSLDGQLTVATSPGQGTRVTASVPWRRS
jgi:signal transduction histidine kinase